jgi:DNA-binding transcriptional ArsR family regulator
MTIVEDDLDRTFAALADPTRRAILARLAQEDEVTVNELANPFPVTVQAISKHLKVLEHAGLITRGRTAQLRPSRLEGAPLREAALWLEEYRQRWGGASTASPSTWNTRKRRTAPLNEQLMQEHTITLERVYDAPRTWSGEPGRTPTRYRSGGDRRAWRPRAR